MKSSKPLYIFEGNPIDINYFKNNFDAISAIYARMADEDSRQVMADVLVSYLTNHGSCLGDVNFRQYWHPVVHVQDGDIVLDGGVWDGATTRDMASHVGKNGHIYAFEPLFDDPNGIIGDFDEKILLNKCGLWSKRGVLYINNFGASSYVSDRKESADSLEIEVTSVDEYLKTNNLHCSVLKLDVEGAEPQVIEGAISTIQQCSPKLLISVYHNPHYQFFDIPKRILEINDGYKFFLGHHEYFYTETVLYAIKM